MVDLVILASSGRIRRLRFEENSNDPIRKPHLVEDPDGVVELRNDQSGDIVTDQSGRFSRKSPSGQEGGMSTGGGHNLDQEVERQAVKRVAEIIAKFVADAGYPRWRLIAPGKILHGLVEELPESTRSKITDTESSDLTKLPIKELEKRLLA